MLKKIMREKLIKKYKKLELVISKVRFHRFEQVKFPDGGSVLGSSQFSIHSQMPLKMMFDLKVVKIDPKIIISLC